MAALSALVGTELQVLVVGGGIVGVGVALGVVSRGLSVGLVEARDFGSGTSSRSSKLIHGGLRYLEQLDLPLVRRHCQSGHYSCSGLLRIWSSRCRSCEPAACATTYGGLIGGNAARILCRPS